MHILLVHVVIKMKSGLITKPCSSGYCLFVLENHLGHHRSQLSWLYWPYEGLAAFEFCMERSLHLELSCMLLMLPIYDVEKDVYRFPGLCINVRTTV